METILVLAIILIVYSIAVILFMRFFAFVRSCDSEMRLMIEHKKVPRRFHVIAPKKKRARKARAPRLAPA